MDEHFHAVMDRNIFNLKLSVEAASAYILVTAIVGENVSPSLENIRDRWTKSEGELHEALTELLDRNVLQVRKGSDEQSFYYPNPSSVWR